ncbi:MAG: DegT/DnrJ/EryC1/StrS family aminotransferase [Thermoleophilia bacterium]|nr:DegT/DnrJ/EryC1/StrS family aminotransferase [Thermoleophilia bacterium]
MSVPLSRPFLGEREEALVLEVLRSGRLSLGPWVDRFERALAERVGAPYVAAVSSGTAGLHLCCRLAGLGPGDEAITSPFSFVASANCILYEGATPVFADVDPRTLNLDPAAVEAAITPATKAIVAVDIFGYPCELGPLRELADRHGLALVEDACEALGAVYRDRPIGSFEQPAVFAFYPNKQITTAEGGAVAVHTEAEWRLLKSLSNQGRADAGGWLEHARFGFNYRLSDVAAAIGIAQVERLDEIVELRAGVAARYAALLGGVAGAEPPCPDDAEHRRSWFVYPVRLTAGIDREVVIAHLAGRGIGTARYLPSIHLQPYMRERFGYREGMLPASEAASREHLAIPFHTGLTVAEQELVVAELAAALDRAA